MNICCDVRDRILDAECLYTDGKFTMGSLPGCLPNLFSVRFRATADFTAGDVIVVDKQEYPVITSQMEAASTHIFKNGAVVLCEIDRDREMAFIRTGGAACATEDVEFQSSDLVYYIDPYGDDSPNNPGDINAPFKTLAGAGKAAWENIVMNPLGRLIFSFNPGNYELTTEEQAFMTAASHPRGLVFRGSDATNKPLLISGHFISHIGERTYQDMVLRAINPTSGHVVAATMNASIFLTRVELIISGPNCDAVYSVRGGAIQINETLKVNGNGNTLKYALGTLAGCIWSLESVIEIANTPSVVQASVFCQNGDIRLNGSSLTGTVSGKRYDVTQYGIIGTGNAGPNFIPGTIAGTTSTGGLYI